jgi:DNA-directed RNA polymerase subunit RPC12/RpoP
MELISRQMALDRIDKAREELLSLGMKGAEHILVHYGRRVIEELPTIEPKPGKWETVDDGDGDCHYQCSFCGEEWFLNEGTPSENDMNYCPNCGAKMGDDWEEPEINPCRGCDDYDGRGGCTSHGGCGAERSEEDENWYTELDDPKIAERDEDGEPCV